MAAALLMAMTPGSRAAAQVGPTHPERMAMIETTYHHILWREPTEYEIFWWTLYPDEPVGVLTSDSLRVVLLQTLRNSPQERKATSQRVRDATGAHTSKAALEALVASKGFADTIKDIQGHQ